MEEVPRQENTESIEYHLKLAGELSALFTKMQSDGDTDDHIDEILAKYKAIDPFAEEESMSDSTPVDQDRASDVVETREEILELIRPIDLFLKTKGRINYDA